MFTVVTRFGCLHALCVVGSIERLDFVAVIEGRQVVIAGIAEFSLKCGPGNSLTSLPVVLSSILKE